MIWENTKGSFFLQIRLRGGHLIYNEKISMKRSTGVTMHLLENWESIVLDHGLRSITRAIFMHSMHLVALTYEYYFDSIDLYIYISSHTCKCVLMLNKRYSKEQRGSSATESILRKCAHLFCAVIKCNICEVQYTKTIYVYASLSLSLSLVVVVVVSYLRDTIYFLFMEKSCTDAYEYTYT